MIQEEELIDMLAVLRKQQQALSQQHNLVIEATANLLNERKKLDEALAAVKALPDQVLKPLAKAATDGAAAGVTAALEKEKAGIDVVVTAAVSRIAAEIENAGVRRAVLGSLISGLVITTAVVLLGLYALFR